MITKLLDVLENSFDDFPDIHQVVLGDLNTYLTTEWPIDFLEDPFSTFSSHSFNPCHNAFDPWIKNHQKGKNKEKIYFRDVWEEAFPRKSDGNLVNFIDNTVENYKALGHTFPAYKDSSLNNCRPDRILRRNLPNFDLYSVGTFGDEMWYDANDFQRSNPRPLSDHLGVLVEFFINN